VNELAIRGLAIGVVAAQLALPVAVGAPILRSKKLADEMSADKRQARKARRRDRERGGGPSTLDAKKLAPLKCAACGAPVPLQGQVFPCPHCGAEVKPPAEYVAALNDREATAAELVKAERMWRWSRWTSSPLLLWPLRFAMIAWLGLVLFGAAVLGEDWPKMVLFLAIILAIVFVGLAWISGMAGERKQLPPLPKNEVFDGPAADGVCTSCGAPVRFPEKRIAMLCLYCTAEAYRASVAKAEERKAKTDHAAAGQSLLDAMIARRDRRDDLLLFFAFMGIAEIFYGVVFTFVALADFIGC
jgi:hypothetical protein